MMEAKRLNLANTPPLSDDVADQLFDFICAFEEAFFKAYEEQLIRQYWAQQVPQRSEPDPAFDDIPF